MKISNIGRYNENSATFDIGLLLSFFKASIFQFLATMGFPPGY
jgi:hypothetical protein